MKNLFTFLRKCVIILDIIHCDPNENEQEISCCSVEEDSVGQYTGFEDKKVKRYMNVNNIKIY